MRIKMLVTTLVAGVLSLNVQAGFEQFNDPVGVMNVYDTAGTTYIETYSPYGLEDLQAITTNDRTFELIPNVTLYADNPGDAVWRNNAGDGPDGNRTLEQNVVFEISPLTADITAATFDFDVDEIDIDLGRYQVTGFIKVLDLVGLTYAELDIVTVPITATNTFNLTLPFAANRDGQLLQAGWAVKGLNANPTSDWGSVTVTVTSLAANSIDFIPPEPSPMLFSIAPVAISDSAITMTASNAVDFIYDVEYLFTNTVNNTSSGWQSSPVFTDTGLMNSTMYSYKVKARDTGVNANETDWSVGLASATTSSEDTTPPTPGTMSITSTDVSPITIKLVASSASDPSGVEYYFENTAGGGNDSGWLSTNVYFDTGLAPGGSYSYTVVARDLSAAQNSNGVSAVTALMTPDVDPGAFTNSLKGFSGNTDDPDFVMDLENAGFSTGSEHPSSTVDFDGTGATFGDGLGFTARNIIRTISTNYADVSFEAYATLTFTNNIDLSGFIGIGQGLQIGVAPNYGVPELNLGGVNGVVAQFKDNTAGSKVYKCNLFKFIGGNATPAFGGIELLSDPVGSTEIIRARLTYDAVAETVNVSFDKNYTGGTFSADQDMGTVSTTNGLASMWDGAPVRIYVGGGEGTRVTDFEVVVSRAAQPPFDVELVDLIAGPAAILSWDGVLGRYYDVQYSTNLVDGLWMDDPSLGATNIPYLGSPMSATSTINESAVFFRVLSR